MVVLKIILLFAFGAVLYQDIRERAVFWFLFPLIALCAGMLFYFGTVPELFYMATLLNVAFVVLLLLAVFLYGRLKLRTAFSSVFGLGDVLFFFAVCCSFSTVSFIVVFCSALVFSLILHLLVSKNQTPETVPLAGYMGLFFGLVYLGSWLGLVQSVYQI